MTVTIDRRQFLKASAAVGGGLALEFSMPGAALAQGALAAPPEIDGGTALWRCLSIELWSRHAGL